ncbi:uncharacterized protein J4E88_008825 [Alternaria novae-zelandiae]|uniref:uncharacterized protein n=1 Tax=Alternaria novae-zelandiae TaxID=430562 RepID=UPI0020C5756A|nr:uncharacterized protein J4E88_008825 [Alternaria novae-zelandiae]KAI4673213.1 hypothetical protein J4E88_008825 [Alternaria novae-zelandiae]
MKGMSAAMPSPMEGKSGLASAHSTSIVLLLLLPLVSIGIFYTGAQHVLLPVLHAYLPGQLLTYLPPSVWEGTANSKEPQGPKNLLIACADHQYTTEIISLDPLVIYINNFTSAREAEGLITLGSPEFAESFISRSRGNTQRVTGRTSQSAPLSLGDPLVECLLNRARTFVGSMLLPSEPFSIPQLVRYFPGQKYNLHTDFWPEHQITTLENGRQVYYNRVASFFVFLRDNCTDGYTSFPLVEPSSSIDLDGLYNGKVAHGEMDGEVKGIKFKPIQGNAVFWVNLDKHGNGDRRVVHAGLPVGEGEKIGLNIWPRTYFGYVDGDSVDEVETAQAARQGWSGKWKD